MPYITQAIDSVDYLASLANITLVRALRFLFIKHSRPKHPA
jgi:hypothetical protein